MANINGDILTVGGWMMGANLPMAFSPVVANRINHVNNNKQASE